MGAVTAKIVGKWYIGQGGIDVQEAQEQVIEGYKDVISGGVPTSSSYGHYESRQQITITLTRDVVAPSSFTPTTGARSSFSFGTGPDSAIQFAHAGRSGMGSYRCVRNTLTPVDLICALHEEVEVWVTESTPRIIKNSRWPVVSEEP